MIKVNLSNAENVLSDSHLYQWDLNQTLEIRGLNVATAPQIHFSVRGIKAALVVQSEISADVITVKIPNLILQYGKDVNAYVYIAENDAKSTVKTIIIPVVSRAKPADYVYDEDVPESVKEKLDAEIARSTQADANHDNRLNAIEAELSGGSGVGQVDTTEGASHHGEIFNNYENGYYFKNKATGLYSHAEGSDTTASGDFSHAEGYTAKATGDFSHAEGSGSTASGSKSHAEGDATNAKGDGSHAEGSGTTASNIAAHAEGGYTTASGSYSHAEGYQARASGDYSHTEGSGTKASSANQHVQGKYNVEDAAGTYAMIIGNGTSDTARSNALTVDWNGNIQCGKTDTSGNFTTYGTINGVDITQISSGGGSGVGQVDGNNHGEIFNAYSGSGKNVATGSYAHAEGYKTSAIGSGSHAEGNVAVAYGQNSHAEGYYTYAAISEQHVQGRYNVKDTDGVYAMIIGNGTGDDTRSNRFTVDWNGNIQCGKTDTSGNFTTHGTINGVDVNDLLARIIAIESQLSP